jgi:hypothetical protein
VFEELWQIGQVFFSSAVSLKMVFSVCEMIEIDLKAIKYGKEIISWMLFG